MIKQDIKLDELMMNIATAIKEKNRAEKTVIKAQLRERKWHTDLLHWKDLLIAKEYSI